MNTLIWRLRRMANRLGAAGLAGLALLAAALLLEFAGTAPVRAHVAEQRLALQSLHARIAARAPAAAPAVAVAHPLAALPPTGEAAQQLGELERLARAHGIVLPRGQYNAAAQAGTTLVRWQIALPVEATYPALHAWLAAALERLPNLALDEIKLKRERIESRTLQAELRLSLYVGATP